MHRIVFVNLHANAFLVKTLSKYLWKQSVSLKHRYLLDYLLNSDEIEICSYINESGFSLVQNLPRSVMFFLKRLRFIEHRYIMRKNNIDKNRIRVIKRPSDIHPNDIVISSVHTPKTLMQLSDIDAFKAVSCIHLYGQHWESDLVKSACPSILFNESDLKKHSELFRLNYSWYKGEVLVHPFVAAKRFQRNKPFNERKNLAFSTGTITYRSHPEFHEVYGDSCLQPSRKAILDNAQYLTQLIDCYNSNYQEGNHAKEYKSTDCRLVHLYKVWYNLTHTGQQKKYFSFNMVEKFNDYKMCFVGEEVIGVPGVGFVEGMACGCAYIGQNFGFYEDYGMKEGVHYIGYNGTLEDLKAKITYYQQPEHQEELECIANAGYEFAQTHFREEQVAKELLDKLILAQQKWLSKRNL